MELVVKRFDELTLMEWYEITKIRGEVFLVEQRCCCQDIDEFDLGAYHVYYRDEGNIIAYLRVLDRGVKFDGASIGRVLCVRRRCGIGTALLREGIAVAKDRFGASEITIEAQSYVKSMYEKVGFVQISGEFLEDDIPHVMMTLKL